MQLLPAGGDGARTVRSPVAPVPRERAMHTDPEITTADNSSTSLPGPSNGGGDYACSHPLRAALRNWSVPRCDEPPSEAVATWADAPTDRVSDQFNRDIGEPAMT